VYLKHLRTSNPVASPFAAVRLRNGGRQAFQEGRERDGSQDRDITL
jgi:hypothetical protein